MESIGNDFYFFSTLNRQNTKNDEDHHQRYFFQKYVLNLWYGFASHFLRFQLIRLGSDSWYADHSVDPRTVFTEANRTEMTMTVPQVPSSIATKDYSEIKMNVAISIP